MNFEIQSNEVPAIRIATAIANKVDKELLFVVGGGLGDRMCAEPTLRYAINRFKDCSISLVCDTPELFRHLRFKHIFRVGDPVPAQFLPLYTYPQGGLSNQFFNPNLMHGVDFASLSALRGQLPDECRELECQPSPPKDRELFEMTKWRNSIVLHVGKSWPSRTFPTEWWDDVIEKCFKAGHQVALVGEDCVPITRPELVSWDLRNALSLNDFIWVCKYATSIITNDSSPVHFGATGGAHIAFVPTCRSPDLLYHHRMEQKGWRMKAFYDRRMWELFDTCPNHLNQTPINEVPQSHIINYLPKPEDMISWLERGDT